MTAALLATTGCSLLVREEDGAKEPNLGAYRITVSPSSAAFLLPPLSAPPSPPEELQVTLRAVCVGDSKFLPPDCDQVQPLWDYDDKFVTGFYITIPNRDLPTATAKITVDKYGLRKQYESSSLSGNRVVQSFKFFPLQKPRDLVVTGNRTLNIQLRLPAPAPERQDEPADKPSLSVSSKKIFCFILGQTASSVTEEVTLVPSGPPVALSWEVSDDGDGAAYFTVVDPPNGFELTGGKNVPLRVRYQAADVLPRKALLTLSTPNLKRPIYVLLFGQRQ